MKTPQTILLLFAACIAGLSSTGPHAAEVYTFGVLSQRSAVLTARYWNPIFAYIERRSGIALALKPARTAPESNEAIERGEYDFVYSNTIFQPKLAETGYRVILRPRNEAIRGQIVTLEGATVQSLEGLAGREVGFPSQAAFVGYAVPMDRLLRDGIGVTPVFGGNQEGIMGQLKAGRVIAAGVNDQVMREFAAREGVQYRVLWSSGPFNNLPIAAHPRVPPEVVGAVQEALAGMAEEPEGAAVLDEVAGVIAQKPPYGFLAAGPGDYAAYTEFYRDTLVKDLR